MLAFAVSTMLYKLALAFAPCTVAANNQFFRLCAHAHKRKNYLFCWSELGAEQLGILQSLLVTCRLQEINPYHYLVDVLQRVSMHPASKVEELTPRIWKEKFGDNFLTSDLA